MTARPVQDVVAALLAINGEEKPFELTAEPTPDGAVVVGRWKVWDVRWQSALGAGFQQRDYVLVVQLDGARGTYSFYETDTRSFGRVGVTLAGGVQGQGGKSWFRGKTMGQRSYRIVLGGKVTSEDRQGTTEGTVWTRSFSTADLKSPVFSTMRELGWRPPKDGWFARLTER